MKRIANFEKVSKEQYEKGEYCFMGSIENADINVRITKNSYHFSVVKHITTIIA